jgi:hypothetical protein
MEATVPDPDYVMPDKLRVDMCRSTGMCAIHGIVSAPYNGTYIFSN